jgi:hypothetical protein
MHIIRIEKINKFKTNNIIIMNIYLLTSNYFEVFERKCDRKNKPCHHGQRDSKKT